MAVAPGIHICEEIEKAFQDGIAALTNQDLHNARGADEIRTSVDLTIQRLLDIAKQMDCFFLQKRLLLSVQKPEHLLRENITELTNEVRRKDELIEKYTAKIQNWQNLLQETQGTPSRPPAMPQPPIPQPPMMQGSPSPMGPGPGHPHHMMQHPQHMAPSPANMGQQPMGMQQQMHPPQGGMQQPGGLQGPLAYLERTMSNIGNVHNF